MVKFCSFILKTYILTSITSRNSVENLQKNTFYHLNIDLVNDNVFTKFDNTCLLDLKIWSKNQILMSIKGRNSVVNLQKNKNNIQCQCRSCQ